MTSVERERSRLELASAEQQKLLVSNVEAALKALDNLPESTSFQLGTFPICKFTSDAFRVIESEDDLADLSETLNKALEQGFKWVSVDVEHSKTFSYTGIVCLIQLTIFDGAYRTFLIDTLKLDRQLLCKHIGQGILGN